jgi:Na+/H+ antiporter NhaA
MVIFFFLIGLEIKRELIAGELNDLKRRRCLCLQPLAG